MTSPHAHRDGEVPQSSDRSGNREVAFAVVVTGAASGIGREIARLAALDRQPLLLIDRSDNEATVSELCASGCDVASLMLDLRDADAIAVIKTELAQRGWVCDVLVNAAGFGTFGAASEVGAALQLDLIDVNIRAVTALTLEFLPAMIRRGRGGILNLGSITGYLPGSYMAAYFASKAYIQSFSASISAEVAGSGVTVTCLTPGVARTAFFDKLPIGSSWLFKLLPRTSVEVVANAGWRGFRSGKSRVLPRWSDWLVLIISALFPDQLLHRLLATHWRRV